MKCSKDQCQGRLKVTHTYDTGHTKHQRAHCSVCGQVHCLLTVAEPVTRKGDGANARAKRAERCKCEI